MKAQDRRLKELEAKAGDTNGPILIIREMFTPSKDGPVSANGYYGNRLGLACSTHSVAGESIESFEHRLMKTAQV
tara:strand:- start:46 stop:270 length:225 start_codon:yes stop_codon:yes gene_type:complete